MKCPGGMLPSVVASQDRLKHLNGVKPAPDKRQVRLVLGVIISTKQPELTFARDGRTPHSVCDPQKQLDISGGA